MPLIRQKIIRRPAGRVDALLMFCDTLLLILEWYIMKISNAHKAKQKNEYGAGPFIIENACARGNIFLLGLFYQLKNIYCMSIENRLCGKYVTKSNANGCRFLWYSTKSGIIIRYCIFLPDMVIRERKKCIRKWKNMSCVMQTSCARGQEPYHFF